MIVCLVESRIVQALASFFKIHDSPKFHLTAAVRPSSARCGAPKITRMDWSLYPIYGTVVAEIVFQLRHGDSFILL